MKQDEILKIYEQKLKYFNYSQRTIEIYVHYTKSFLLKINKYYQHLVSYDFQNYLDKYNFSSISQQNQIINAIKFLYEKVLNKKYDKVCFKRPHKENKLPRIIDHNLLVSKIESILNLKHKAILMLTYSVGLRVSEVVNLKIKDIDSKRMLIFINNAKGKKDRIVPLSSKVLETLRDYYKQFKPKEYLFNGQFKNQYSVKSCQEIFKKHIDKSGHFHLLRHSSFTRLLETGTDLRIIQSIAGHKSSKTTEIYTHVSNAILQNVKTAI